MSAQLLLAFVLVLLGTGGIIVYKELAGILPAILGVLLATTIWLADQQILPRTLTILTGAIALLGMFGTASAVPRLYKHLTGSEIGSLPSLAIFALSSLLCLAICTIAVRRVLRWQRDNSHKS